MRSGHLSPNRGTRRRSGAHGHHTGPPGEVDGDRATGYTGSRPWLGARLWRWGAAARCSCRHRGWQVRDGCRRRRSPQPRLAPAAWLARARASLPVVVAELPPSFARLRRRARSPAICRAAHPFRGAGGAPAGEDPSPSTASSRSSAPGTGKTRLALQAASDLRGPSRSVYSSISRGSDVGAVLSLVARRSACSRRRRVARCSTTSGAHRRSGDVALLDNFERVMRPLRHWPSSCATVPSSSSWSPAGKRST